MDNYVHAGHPDLTIFKDGEISVVEVKQKNDKFTTRQPYWIMDKGQKLNMNISVLHITKSIKKIM